MEGMHSSWKLRLHLAVFGVVCVATPRAGVATWKLEAACLLAATITHQLVKLTRDVDVSDLAVALAADLQTASHHV
jgi:hypothetical protein